MKLVEWVAVASGVVGLVSGLVGLYYGFQQAQDSHAQLDQARRQYEQAQQQLDLAKAQFNAGFKPLITFDTEDDPDAPPFGIAIENSGLGPAIIKSVRYYVDGVQMKDSEAAFKQGHADDDSVNYFDFEPNDALAPGKKEWMVSLDKRGLRNKKVSNALADLIDDHLGIEVEFCSLAGGDCATRCSNPGHCSTTTTAAAPTAATSGKVAPAVTIAPAEPSQAQPGRPGQIRQ